MTKEELKAYIKSKANVEGEMLDELTKRIIRISENSLFGMTKTDNMYSLLLKKRDRTTGRENRKSSRK